MPQRSKTRTKTLRFDVRLLEMLREAAYRADKSENEFVRDLLQDRLLIDPLIPAFQSMQMSSGVVQSILGASNADALEAAASDVAKKNFPLVRELFVAARRTLDFEEFVIEVLGKHSGWFYVEGYSQTGRLVLRHSYGLKWSRYLKSFILSAYGTISRDKIEIEITDQVVKIDFRPS